MSRWTDIDDDDYDPRPPQRPGQPQHGGQGRSCSGVPLSYQRGGALVEVWHLDVAGGIPFTQDASAVCCGAVYLDTRRWRRHPGLPGRPNRAERRARLHVILREAFHWSLLLQMADPDQGGEAPLSAVDLVTPGVVLGMVQAEACGLSAKAELPALAVVYSGEEARMLELARGEEDGAVVIRLYLADGNLEQLAWYVVDIGDDGQPLGHALLTASTIGGGEQRTSEPASEPALGPEDAPAFTDDEWTALEDLALRYASEEYQP